MQIGSRQQAVPKSRNEKIYTTTNSSQTGTQALLDHAYVTQLKNKVGTPLGLGNRKLISKVSGSAHNDSIRSFGVAVERAVNQETYQAMVQRKDISPKGSHNATLQERGPSPVKVEKLSPHSKQSSHCSTYKQ
jgi:hypothetical protein